MPDSYEEKATDFKIDENGQKWRRMGNICWFTNLDMEKRHKELTLFKRYTPAEHPKYDNYDAIEVGKTTDIPCDCEGMICVPITANISNRAVAIMEETALKSDLGGVMP